MRKGFLISLAFFTAGVFVLIQIIWPLLTYKIWEFQFIDKENLLVSPQIGEPKKVLGISIIQIEGNFPALVSENQRGKNLYNSFNLTIPSLKINQAVYVESNDLSLGLVHLPGSALPGERGNVFISGHSAIPIGKFSSAVFADLPKIKQGDRITLQVAGSEFNYQVLGIKIASPTDLSVVNPPDDDRYVTLMTCVPPGLNTKRLIVLGKLM